MSNTTQLDLDHVLNSHRHVMGDTISVTLPVVRLLDTIPELVARIKFLEGAENRRKLLEAKNRELMDIFTIVCSCLTAATDAEDDDLPAKAISLREEVLTALALFRPIDGEYPASASKLRHENYSLFTELCVRLNDIEKIVRCTSKELSERKPV